MIIKILNQYVLLLMSINIVNTIPTPTPSREGIIIECPLNDLFHDVVTVILTSRMGVSEMVVNVGNVVTVICGIIHSGLTIIFQKNHDF